MKSFPHSKRPDYSYQSHLKMGATFQLLVGDSKGIEKQEAGNCQQ